MKIAVIADSHFSEHSRFEECVRLHHWIAADAMARGVDLVLHSGDVYDAKSTPTERREVAECVAQIASFAPIVIVRGNHDVPGDLPLLARLRTNYPVIVEEAAAVHVVAGVAVACLAWPRKAELLALTGQQDHEAGERIATDALRSVLLGMRGEIEAHNGPTVLLTHAMVRGSRTSSGQPLVGCDFELGIDDLALCDADFVALGHIHQHQAWTSNGAPIVYPGAPRRTAFGETEAKGYVLWDTDAGWSFREAPATQMVLIESEWAEEHVGLPGDRIIPGGFTSWGEDARGAEVRFRYHVGADRRDAARVAAVEVRASLLQEGAVLVKVEEVVETTTRARAPEVARAKTLADKLRAYWQAKGDEPTPERADRLLDRLRHVEAA